MLHNLTHQQFSDSVWWRHNKSKMADGCHIESRFLDMYQRDIVPLMWNLSEEAESHPDTSRYINSKIWKFRMAGGHHFENGCISISQLKIIGFQWSFILRCVTCFQSRPMKNHNFANSQWQTDALLKTTYHCLLDFAHCTTVQNVLSVSSVCHCELEGVHHWSPSLIKSLKKLSHLSFLFSEILYSICVFNWLLPVQYTVSGSSCLCIYLPRYEFLFWF